MRNRRLPYKEGDWVVIPLPGGGQGLGLIARMNGRGIILAYFFGPRLDSIPRPEYLLELTAKKALVAHLVGDLHILEGRWNVIPNDEVWDRSKWPMPQFRREASRQGKAYRVTYSEDSLRHLGDELVDADHVTGLQDEGIMGAGYAEKIMDRMLS